jgi:glycosyltransferase involved in cell wall biosynthesis
MKIGIVGPLPPPFGGISIHVQRIREKLLQQGTQVTIFNEAGTTHNPKENIHAITSLKWQFFQFFFGDYDILHFHALSVKLRILLGFMRRISGIPVVLTIHGKSLQQQLTDSSWLVKKLLLCSLHQLDRIVCVRQDIKECLLEQGIPAEKIAVIPAYVHPTSVSSLLPDSIKSFMENGQGPLLVANGWIRFDQDQELYGLSQLIKLSIYLKQQQIPARLIFCLIGKELLSNKETELYNSLIQQITEGELKNHFLLYEEENLEFTNLLTQAQLFLRPTTTDGFSVSLAEAIHLGVPSIASDCILRPEGTITYQTSNFDTLCETVEETLNNLDLHKSKTSQIAILDYAQPLLENYRSIFQKNNI